MNLIKAVIIKIQNLNPAKAYLEPSWISSVKHFFENSWRPSLTIFTNISIVDISLGSIYSY